MKVMKFMPLIMVFGLMTQGVEAVIKVWVENFTNKPISFGFYGKKWEERGSIGFIDIGETRTRSSSLLALDATDVYGITVNAIKSDYYEHGMAGSFSGDAGLFWFFNITPSDVPGKSFHYKAYEVAQVKLAAHLAKIGLEASVDALIVAVDVVNKLATYGRGPSIGLFNLSTANSWKDYLKLKHESDF